MKRCVKSGLTSMDNSFAYQKVSSDEIGQIVRRAKYRRSEKLTFQLKEVWVVVNPFSIREEVDYFGPISRSEEQY